MPRKLKPETILRKLQEDPGQCPWCGGNQVERSNADFNAGRWYVEARCENEKCEQGWTEEYTLVGAELSVST